MEFKRCIVNRRISALHANGYEFLPIGDNKYVTVFPICMNCKSLEEAKKVIKKFEKKFGYPASMTTEDEWDKVVALCAQRCWLSAFVSLNNFKQNIVVNATNLVSTGFVFRAGPGNNIDDKYYKSWEDTHFPINVFATVTIE